MAGLKNGVISVGMKISNYMYSAVQRLYGEYNAMGM